MTYLFSTLIFLLLSGYIASNSTLLFRYITGKQTGYRLILTTLIFGIGIYICTYSLQYFSGVFCTPFYVCNTLYEKILAPFLSYFHASLLPIAAGENFSHEQEQGIKKLITTSINSLALSVAIYLLIAYFRAISGAILPERLVYWIKKNASITKRFILHSGYKAKFLSKSFEKAMPVFITLDSRKSYVGYILALPNPYIRERDDWSIKILPLQSGYRDSDTLDLELNNHYDQIWEEYARQIHQGTLTEDLKTRILNAGVIIKWDDIETMSEWIPELYHELYTNRTKNQAGAVKKKSASAKKKPAKKKKGSAAKKKPAKKKKPASGKKKPVKKKKQND